MTDPDAIFDVAVIGAGPAGLSCAMYASRARLKVVVFDKSPEASALAYSPKIANYPGVRGEPTGTELLDAMREQAIDFGSQYVRAAVQGLDVSTDPKELYTTEGVYRARTIVVATGTTGRTARFSGESEYLGRGVSYCVVCDAPFFEGKTCAVIGDTDVALDESLYLARFAKKVILVAPRRRFYGDAEFIQSVMEEPKIERLMGWKVSRISGDEFVNSLTIISGDEERTLQVDGVFVLLAGTNPVTDYLQYAVPRSEDGCLIVDVEQRTPVPGVYAAGDVTCSHVKQAVVASAEGVIAAMAIDKDLNKLEKTRTDYK